MKKCFAVLMGLQTLMLVHSCSKDIIASDITKKTVNILAPGDGVHTPYNGVTFWWDEVKGADKYELQLVSPSFANVVKLVADTFVTGTKLTLTLTPGSYQWRVRATNNAGSTPYSTRSFVVDSTSNLAYVTVGLLSPVDSFYTKQTTQAFSWSSVPAATQYEIYLMDHTGATLTYSATTATTFAYTFNQAAGTNAIYTWKVRAQNNFSNSHFSVRTLFINQARPAAPVPVHPVNTGTITVNDSLTWTHASGIVYDSLFVSKDTGFTVPILALKQTSTNRKIVPTDTLAPNRWFYKDSTYYWRLNSTDHAGNTSLYSTRKSFKGK